MFMLLVISAIIVLTILLIVSATKPQHEELQADFISIQRIVLALLTVVEVALLIGAFDWPLGIFLSLIVVLFYGSLSRVKFFENVAERLYVNYDLELADFIKRHPNIFAALRVMPRHTALYQLNSRDELERLVKDSGDLLTGSEKKFIVHSLAFADKNVKSVMTPRSMISTIQKDEFLGPLVLDELHSVGHSRLPVIAEDIDHIVGVLHLNDLLSLSEKKSSTAEDAMDKRVFYIHEDETLQHALAAFLRSRRHLFIVVNEFRETVGILTLEDVVEALLGQKIIDEGDNHDDLRSVAARNPKKNNQPTGHVDV